MTSFSEVNRPAVPNAVSLLRTIRENALSRASRYLGAVFADAYPLSTVFFGERAVDTSPEVEADIRDLAAALPRDTISRDPVLGDCAWNEPYMVRAIRQVEGCSPAVPVTIQAPNQDVLKNALLEARAMGWRLGPHDRGFAVVPLPQTDVVEQQTGRLRITAGTSWGQLLSVAQRHGLSAQLGMPDRFVNPMQAAAAGLFRHVEMANVSDIHWGANFDLPPASCRCIERSWHFHDQSAAEAAFAHVVRTYSPQFCELLPTIDGGIAAAAGLMKRHRRFEAAGGAILRVVCAGPSLARTAALLDASWGIERRGGLCVHRGPWPDRFFIEALAAASGTARIVREPGSGEAPKVARVQNTPMAIRGQIVPQETIWYVRRLGDSVPEALFVAGNRDHLGETKGSETETGAAKAHNEVAVHG